MGLNLDPNFSFSEMESVSNNNEEIDKNKETVIQKPVFHEETVEESDEDIVSLFDKDKLVNNFNSNVETIKSEVVTEVPNGLTNEEFLKNRTYGVSEVAEMLGVNTQTVRNYCNEFSKFLNVERTAAGHTIYHYSDIQTLKDICSLRSEGGMTLSNIKLLLESNVEPSNGSTSVGQTLFIQQVNKTLTETLEQRFQELESKQIAALSDMIQISSRELLLEAQKKDEFINNLIEENKSKQLSLEEKEAINKEKDDLILKLTEKIDSLQETVNQIQDNTTKKKGFHLFG